MSLQYDKISLEKAIKWISEKIKSGSSKNMSCLIDKASLRFDLSPDKVEYLFSFFNSKKMID